MYVAYYFYTEKALRSVRLRGKTDFEFPGGFNYDAFEMIKKYGIVQRSDYTGLLPQQTEYRHAGFQVAVHREWVRMCQRGGTGRIVR